MHVNQVSTKPIVVIGLGKSGYSAAQFLLSQGNSVIAMDTREQAPYKSTLLDKFPAVKIIEGKLDETVLLSASKIVLSPGVAQSHPAIQAAVQSGVDLVSDIQVFAESVDKPIIAITGSNAKSTVTTLVGDMAKACGLNAAVGGNLGQPALDLIAPDVDVYILELSSFQLETTYSLNAKVATVLNVSPDHLDRYESFEHYYKTKYNIFNGCQKAVINLDDPLSQPAPLNCPQQASFSISQQNQADFTLIEHNGSPYLAFNGEPILSVSQLKIKGTHNYSNALAALAIGFSADFPMQHMIRALTEFPGLDHRCQWVAHHNGVDFINDSKGTNVGATLAALQGLGPEYAGNIVLMLGGEGKGADFSLLIDDVQHYVSHVIAYGADKQKIAQALFDVCDLQQAESFDDAFNLAVHAASKNAAVLLSPACASFDMFSGFEARGNAFISKVRAL